MIIAVVGAVGTAVCLLVGGPLLSASLLFIAVMAFGGGGFGIFMFIPDIAPQGVRLTRRRREQVQGVWDSGAPANRLRQIGAELRDTADLLDEVADHRDGLVDMKITMLTTATDNLDHVTPEVAAWRDEISALNRSR